MGVSFGGASEDTVGGTHLDVEFACPRGRGTSGKIAAKARRQWRDRSGAAGTVSLDRWLHGC